MKKMKNVKNVTAVLLHKIDRKVASSFPVSYLWAKLGIGGPLWKDQAFLETTRLQGRGSIPSFCINNSIWAYKTFGGFQLCQLEFVESIGAMLIPSFRLPLPTCCLYYKHITIVIDTASVVSKCRSKL